MPFESLTIKKWGTLKSFSCTYINAAIDRMNDGKIPDACWKPWKNVALPLCWKICIKISLEINLKLHIDLVQKINVSNSM